MSGPATRTAAAELARTLRGAVAVRRVTETGIVQSVTRDASGFPTAALVRVGDVDVPNVPLAGRAARVGDTLLLSRAAGQVAAPEWQVDGYVSSLSPAAVLDDDVTIPAPAWGSPPLATAVVTPHAGGQHATVTARVRETPERFGPERTEVQWASDADAAAGRWASTQAGNVGGQDAELVLLLPAALPFGLTLNVRARTWTSAGARSPWSDTRTVVTATDTTTPAAPTGFAVDTTKHLTLIVTLPAPSQPLVFDHWDVSIATSSAGAGAVTTAVRGSTHIHTTAGAQALYVRIREVTRAGVAGGWYPSSSWAGPYQVAATDSYVDTTPPPAPSLTSLNVAQELIQGTMGVTLTATLAAYTKPGDFAWFELQWWDGTATEYQQSQETVIRRVNARQGVTYQAIVRAWDRNGNASAWSAPLSVLTPTVAAPTGAPAITVVQAGFRAILVSWTQVPDSAVGGQVVGYELQRNRSDEAPTIWLQVTVVDALRFAQTNLDHTLLFRYRVRAINAAGAPGPWSTETAFVQPLAIQTADVVANTLSANVIQAGSITVDKLAATLDLTAGRKIAVAAGGTIEAAGGQVVLSNQGLDLMGLTAIRVVNSLNQTIGWLGRGLLPNTAVEMLSFQIDEMVIQAFSSPDSYLVLSPEGATIQFALNDVITRQVGDGGLQRWDPAVGIFRREGWTSLATPGPVITLSDAAANTDHTFTATSYGVPAGARAVHLRGAVALRTGGGHIYAFPTGGHTERGLYATVTAANSWVPWAGPPVPLSAGNQFTFRGSVNFDCGMMVVAYEW